MLQWAALVAFPHFRTVIEIGNMLFNSFHFAFFFPAVAAAYFLAPQAARGAVLIAAGYYCCMAAHPAFALALLFATLVNYSVSRALMATTRPAWRRLELGLAIALGLGQLFAFKYYAFFLGALEAALDSAGMALDWPVPHPWMPIGLSFYTLVTLGYTFDVYAGRQSAERRLDRFAAFAGFFPLLAAGPIERGPRLLPQFGKYHAFEYDRVTQGLKLMTWGLFKKVVMADRLAVMVDSVYGDPSARPGPAMALALLFYTYQIYCDFSGYTDMALGAAQVLGFRVMPNFDRPYASASVSEFWRRWHISLSTWFRDYLYIPLGGNRTSALRWTAIIFLVFAASGLWHGARWTFVVWGLMHAAFLAVQRLSAPIRSRCFGGSWPGPKLRHAACVALTFLCVALAWVIFRAESLKQAGAVYRALGAGWGSAENWAVFRHAPNLFGVPAWECVLMLGLILFLEMAQAAHTRCPWHERLSRQPRIFRWAIYSAGLWTIFVLGSFTQKEFIYVVF